LAGTDCCGFQGPNHSGPNRPDAATCLAASGHCSCQLGRDLEGLSMHPVLTELLSFNRLEGAGTNFQVQISDFHALATERVEQCGGEMQTCRRCSNAAFPPREDGL